MSAPERGDTPEWAGGPLLTRLERGFVTCDVHGGRAHGFEVPLVGGGVCRSCWNEAEKDMACYDAGYIPRSGIEKAHTLYRKITEPVTSDVDSELATQLEPFVPLDPPAVRRGVGSDLAAFMRMDRGQPFTFAIADGPGMLDEAFAWFCPCRIAEEPELYGGIVLVYEDADGLPVLAEQIAAAVGRQITH